MSATVAAPDKTKSGEWSLARVQDDLTRNYNPVGAFEIMLITQMAQTFVRLQTAYDVERRYSEGRDMLVVITTKPAEFKAVQGYVRDCERAWNHAKENLEKAQRKRQRDQAASTNTSRIPLRPQPPVAEVPSVLPADETPLVVSAAPRRE